MTNSGKHVLKDLSNLKFKIRSKKDFAVECARKELPLFLLDFIVKNRELLNKTDDCITAVIDIVNELLNDSDIRALIIQQDHYLSDIVDDLLVIVSHFNLQQQKIIDDLESCTDEIDDEFGGLNGIFEFKCVSIEILN
jgi:hypothetical protein